MNQPSAFQVQYPLSPKKFWNKIIKSLLLIFIFTLVVYLFISFFIIPNTDVTPTIGLFISKLAVIFLIIFIFYAFYIKAYIKRYYYDCGEQFITIKKGVFAPAEIHVQYQKIQDVYVDQDIIDRMMGLYDVHIASATVTSGIEAHIDGVNADVAENLKNIILAKIHGASNSSSSIQTPISQPQQSAINSVQLNQKISSNTYPISGLWVFSVMLSSLFLSFVYSLVFAFFILKVGFLYALAFLGIIFILHFIYFSIWKQNYYFEFTPDYILLRTGVISRSENHLPYRSIQNILNNQSIFDRILGLSAVTIQNAAQQIIQSSGLRRGTITSSNISLVWQPKEKAEELTNILNNIVNKINPQNSHNAMGL